MTNRERSAVPRTKRKHWMLLPATLCIFIFVLSSTSLVAQNQDNVQLAVKQFEAGQDAHEKGNLPEAVAAYQKALELLPEFPEAELQLGTAYLALKNTAKAETAFRRALALREDWSLAMTNLGSLLVTLEKYDEAEPLLKKAAAADPDNSLALTALIELKLDTNAPRPELLGLLDKITRITEKFRPGASLFSAKASIENRLGRTDDARNSATKALAIDPKNRTALALLADDALLASDPAKAEGYVRLLESVAHGEEETVVLRSRIMVAQGKATEAAAALALIQKPSAGTLKFMADLKGSETKDLPTLESLVAKEPDNVAALSNLCLGFRVKDPTKALEYCRRASILEPKEISNAVNFAAALVQAKQYEKAVRLLQKLLTIAPNHATIRANLATALFQLKRYPEAKTEFRWLTENQPNSAIAYYFLGITFDQLGEYLDALANYQKFLKLADPAANGLEIEKVNLRLPVLQRQIRNGKGRKSE